MMQFTLVWEVEMAQLKFKDSAGKDKCSKGWKSEQMEKQVNKTEVGRVWDLKKRAKN